MSDPDVAIRDRETALTFLFGRIDYERNRRIPYRSRRFTLDRMRELSRRLGDPQQGLPAVHIAGTKGKGSTAAMTAAVLSAAGYRTGLYTSPHLEQLEERFVIDGRQCSGAELVELLAAIQPVVRAMDHEARARGESQGPTYFEITTAAALLHFRRQQVDCAVIEVGLGGRLDSTNICEPLLSVITSISYDHTRQLGSTLEAIAGEKAGIIKPGVTVVSGVRQTEPLAVVQRVASQRRAPLLTLNRDFQYRYLPYGPTRGEPAAAAPAGGLCSALDYREVVEGVTTELASVELGLLGEHQAVNASVALAGLHQLRRAGWEIPESALRDGLRQARCPARIEVLAGKPTVVLDAAHNLASIEALLDVLVSQFPRSPRVLVFASSQDKDAAAMLQRLVPEFEHVVLTRYLSNPRSVPPAELDALVQKIVSESAGCRCRAHLCENPVAAWRHVGELARPETLVCVTGSFFLAAELRKLVLESKAAALPCL